MTPGVKITKQDGNTGVVRPGNVGRLAIIAACAAGTPDQASEHVDETLAKAEFSWGPLTEFAGLAMPVTKASVVLVRSVATQDGGYSAITKVGAGTSVPTAGTPKPYDDFDVVVTFPKGATVGVAGATWNYSLDGGKTTSKTFNLGTANTITIPDTNIEIDLGSGTITDGETLSFTTTRPRPTNADLPAALEALRVTSSKFEAVLIDCFADDTTVSLVAAWLLTLNAVGRYPVAFLTVRPMNDSETETQYKDAMAALLASSACVDIVLCAEEADMVSVFRGIAQRRPFGLPTASRAMAVSIGVEPAYVELGALPGCRITDARNNPKHHNEEKFPGLDDLRLTTARTIEGFEGVYITNTNLLSPSGSDFVYLPHARTMNRAAELAWQVLTKQLSVGVGKNPKPGPNGERYISDSAAQQLEHLVQDAIDPEVKGSVDDLKFRISRTDNIASNAGAKLKCFLESVALSYVKEFDVTARYVKQITQAPGT